MRRRAATLIALVAGCSHPTENTPFDAVEDARVVDPHADSVVVDAMDASLDTDPTPVADAAPDVVDAVTVKDTKPADTGPKTYKPTDVVWVVVDDKSGGGARLIEISQACDVTYNGKPIGKGTPKDCTALFARAVDPTILPTCDPTPTGGWYVVATMQTNDFVTHTRDLNLERCVPKLPGGGGDVWKIAIGICESALGSFC